MSRSVSRRWKIGRNLNWRPYLVFLVCSLIFAYQSSPLGRPAPQQITETQCTSAPSSAVKAHADTLNLISNPKLTQTNPDNAKRPMNWTPSAYGKNNPTYRYLSSGHANARSIRVDLYDYKNGAANWLFESLPVTPDQQYYFSDYYQSNVPTQIEASFFMPDGQFKYEILGFVPPSQSWQHFETTFTAPLGAQTFTVYQHIQSNGYLTTSDYELTSYHPQGFPTSMATLTFDDGYESTYTYGLPLLEKYHLPSTQFIITDLIGDKNYVTKQQLRTFIAQGHEIASHTVTHNLMNDEPTRVLQAEVTQSASTLKHLTHNEIPNFAYPQGVHNHRVEQAVAGQYIAARGVEIGLNSADNLQCYNLKTQDIHSDTTPAQVMDWIHQAQATNTWLILVYHSVEPDKSTTTGKSLFNVTPTQLEQHLQAIKSSGIQIRTLGEALKGISKPAPVKSTHVELPFRY